MNLDPETLKKIIALLKEEDGEGALKLLEEIASGGPSAEAPADPTAAAADPPAPTEEEQAMAALARDVVALTRAANAGDAATRLKSIVAAHEEIEKRTAALEASERLGLVVKLVELRCETPATAWQRGADGEILEGDARKLVKRLAEEPIAELRSRVEALAKVRGVRIQPPASDQSCGPPLSKAAQAYCVKNNMTEAQYRARKDSAVRRSA